MENVEWRMENEWPDILHSPFNILHSLPMFHPHLRPYPSPHVEVTLYDHVPRVDCVHQIGSDFVGDRFVKGAVVAVRPEVVLE